MYKNHAHRDAGLGVAPAALPIALRIPVVTQPLQRARLQGSTRELRATISNC